MADVSMFCFFTQRTSKYLFCGRFFICTRLAEMPLAKKQNQKKKKKARFPYHHVADADQYRQHVKLVSSCSFHYRLVRLDIILHPRGFFAHFTILHAAGTCVRVCVCVCANTLSSQADCARARCGGAASRSRVVDRVLLSAAP